MSWKIVRHVMSSLPGSAPRRSGSIALKIALHHILAVFFIFSVSSFLMYFKLVSHLNKTGTNTLREEIVTVQAILKAANGLELLKYEFQRQLYEKESLTPHIRLIDRHGGIISESPGMGEFLPVAKFPLPDSNPETIPVDRHAIMTHLKG